MMQTLDTDRDGQISFTEFQAAKTVAEVPEKMQEVLFRRFDKNRDGVIEPAELPKGAGPSWKHRPGDGIGHLDANRDGRVSKMEFFESPRIRNIPIEKKTEIFNRIDRNQDGFIDRRDHRHRGPHPGRGRGPGDPAKLRAELDRNQDGEVSFEEFSAHPRFGVMDDGQRRKAFESMDTNGNGKLDAEDMPGAPRRERMRPAPKGPGGPERREPPRAPEA
ncbi:MAG: hypothetical protein HKN82_09965 [Akkermansiaceae bacterium]|nr:hypothetical protein [Akkermansiaceae bacterium]